MTPATRYCIAAVLIARADGVLIAQDIRGAELSFNNIAQSAGASGPTERGRTGGHGVMFTDADGDGRPDLYVTMIFDDPMPELFYRNLDGGRFAEEGRHSRRPSLADARRTHVRHGWRRRLGPVLCDELPGIGRHRRGWRSNHRVSTKAQAIRE